MIKMILNTGYEKKDILDSIAELVDLDFSAFLKVRKPYMTVEQIRQLQMQGFQIGSHSIDHPMYSGLSLDEQIKQTKESLEWIRKAFNLNYSFFAFPFTDENVRKDFFDAVFNPDKPVANLVCGTAGLKKTASPFHIQRVPLEDSRLRARLFISGEYLYYMLKGIAGRNVRKF